MNLDWAPSLKLTNLLKLSFELSFEFSLSSLLNPFQSDFLLWSRRSGTPSISDFKAFFLSYKLSFRLSFKLFLAAKTQLYKSWCLSFCVSVSKLKLSLIPKGNPRFPMVTKGYPQLSKVTQNFKRFQGITWACMQFHDLAYSSMS